MQFLSRNRIKNNLIYHLFGFYTSKVYFVVLYRFDFLMSKPQLTYFFNEKLIKSLGDPHKKGSDWVDSITEYV
jgi:hypothetical protein